MLAKGGVGQETEVGWAELSAGQHFAAGAHGNRRSPGAPRFDPEKIARLPDILHLVASILIRKKGAITSIR